MQDGEDNTYAEYPLHPSFLRLRMSTGQGMVAHKLLDIRRRNGMEVSECLQCSMSSAIFLVGKTLKERRVGFDPLCLEKRVLVLELQAFHKMTEDGESGICEVWCSKGNANSIKEW